MKRGQQLGFAVLVTVCGCGPVSLDEGEGGSEADASSGEADTTSSESGDPGDGDGDPGDGDGEPGDGDGDGDGDPDAPTVLFIGNSYTFANDLPGIVAALGEASTTPLVTDSLTTAGARVADHLDDPELALALEQGFDVVVIQGQSLEPILDYPGFEAGLVELAGLVGDARLILFETWPRAAGHPDLDDLGMSVDDMYGALSSAYFEASLTTDSDVALVGSAFMSALQLDDPPIELYAGDGSHPSLAGSYLAGCVFFGKIVDRACSTSSYAPVGLGAGEVERLQVIADIVNGFIIPGP